MDEEKVHGGKKFFNTVERCVDDCLAGFCTVHPGLQLLEGHRVVVRRDAQDAIKAGKVNVISGGGSGHEPAHAGFIGAGMLSAAVAGAVFTSPPPGSILAAIRAVGTDSLAGVLVVVKNYTGDRLNFGLAVEKAKQEKIKVEMVIVAEDCALASADKTAGRRGLCGTVFIHKIAGALAEQGKSLEEIVTIVKGAAASMGTVGLSLTACSVPGSGPSFHLAQDEMELGLGIHGEAGVKRLKLQTAQEAVKTVLNHMTNPQTSTHLELHKGDRVALMVNNLGGTSVLELNIVAKEAINYLENSLGVFVDRAYCGTFMTSLEMAGISITVLRLNDTLKACLDAPTTAPAWQKPLLPTGASDRCSPGVMKVRDTGSGAGAKAVAGDVVLSKEDAKVLRGILQNVATKLIAEEEHLNSLDRQTGDGDCGSTIARGARALLEQLNQSCIADSPCSWMLILASIAENHMGGTSGALYSLMLTAAAEPLRKGVGASHWAHALHAGVEAVMKYGGGKPGQRTMIDPLVAASTEFMQQIAKQSPKEAFTSAVKAAEAAAEATVKMAAQAGRASYVSPDLLTQPDPGAVAVAIWMRAVLEKLL